MRVAAILRRALLALLVLGLLLFALGPVYWALLTSFTTGSRLFQVDYLPHRLEWSNYAAIFVEQNFGRNLLNSALVAIVTVAGSLAAAVLAAYALSRVEFRGRLLLLYSVLGVSIFPQIAVLTGLFELIHALGLYNDWLGLALSYTIFTLPFTIWVLTAFMREVPAELEDAAAVDGAGAWTIVWRIFLPLMGPALATAGLLAFIAAWNEFLFALTLTLTDRARTVPVAIALISGASQFEIPWGRIMAASVLVTAPLILLTLVFQRRIVAGLTAGSVRG
jgi:trehalose/maltose transport system permease protein